MKHLIFKFSWANVFHEFIQHMLDSEIIINRNKHDETKE